MEQKISKTLHYILLSSSLFISVAIAVFGYVQYESQQIDAKISSLPGYLKQGAKNMCQHTWFYVPLYSQRKQCVEGILNEPEAYVVLHSYSGAGVIEDTLVLKDDYYAEQNALKNEEELKKKYLEDQNHLQEEKDELNIIKSRQSFQQELERSKELGWVVVSGYETNSFEELSEMAFEGNMTVHGWIVPNEDNPYTDKSWSLRVSVYDRDKFPFMIESLRPDHLLMDASLDTETALRQATEKNPLQLNIEGFVVPFEGNSKIFLHKENIPKKK